MDEPEIKQEPNTESGGDESVSSDEWKNFMASIKQENIEIEVEADTRIHGVNIYQPNTSESDESETFMKSIQENIKTTEQMNLKSVLLNAGLSHLYDKFISEDLTVDLLPHLSESETRTLTTTTGDAIRLRLAISKLKNGNTVSQLREQYKVAPIPPQSFTRSPHNVLVPPLRVTAPLPKPPQSITVKKCKLTTNTDDTVQSVDIADVIQQGASVVTKTVPSNALLTAISSKKKYQHFKTKYRNGRDLSTRERDELVRLIIDEVVEKHGQKRVPAAILSAWARQVQELFPSEKSEFYYQPATFKESGARDIRPTGKLIFRLGYVRKISKRKGGEGNMLKRRAPPLLSTSSEVLARDIPTSLYEQQTELDSFDDDDVESLIEWLSETASPKSLVCQRWSQTVQYRAEELQKMEIQKYFSKYKVLHTPIGLDLLLLDFGKAYGHLVNKFTERFPILRDGLLEIIAESDNRNKFQDLLVLSQVGDNQRDLAALLAIPHLLSKIPSNIICVGNKRVNWRPSREELINAFIDLTATTNEEIEKVINTRICLFEKYNQPLLPFIVGVGPSPEEIEQYLIVLSRDLQYSCSSASEAVDKTYKILWALNVGYPKDSLPSWMIIQKFVYEHTSKYDKRSTVTDILFEKLQRTISNALR